MLDCTVMQARERVHLERLDRKISRDGVKRAKLGLAMTGIFIERRASLKHLLAAPGTGTNPSRFF
jgi:hypothetical protein